MFERCVFRRELIVKFEKMSQSESEAENGLKLNMLKAEEYLSNSGRRRASHEGSIFQSISYTDTSGSILFYFLFKKIIMFV